MTEKRVQLSKIVKNQVPEYVRTDFPLISEFLKEYYRGQEYQGGPIDLINNIDQYNKIDSFTNTVSSVELSRSISATEKEIIVDSTQGFPDEYGLLKIEDEVITYTGKTETTFTGCIRGFSGICDYTNGTEFDSVLFEITNAKRHKKGDDVINLSVLFLAEFLNKKKIELAEGFDDRSFDPRVNQNTFLKQVRSFYASKGTEESFKILFKALYGANVELVNPTDLLFRPSDAQYDQVESLIVEPTINVEKFDKIENITLFQDSPSKSYAPIAYSERVVGNRGQLYYRLDIDAGYNRDITFDGAIYGDFKITPKTKLLNKVSTGATVFDVDSTVGFGQTGNLRVNYSDGTSGIIYYGSKTINQFRDIDFIFKEIEEEGSIVDSNTFAYATIDGERVECNISSIINQVDIPKESVYNKKGILSRVKTLGFEGNGPKINDWVYNHKIAFTVKTVSVIDPTDNTYQLELNNKQNFRDGDIIDVIDNSGTSIKSQIKSIVSDTKINIISDFALDTNAIYTLKKRILKGIAPNFRNIENYHTNVQNIYKNSDDSLLVASSSIPSEAISINSIDLEINGTFEGTDITFTRNHGLNTGDKVQYYTESITRTFFDVNGNRQTEEIEGTKLFNAGIYYVSKVDDQTLKFAISKENIFIKKFVTFESTTVKNNKIRLYDFHEQILQDQKLLREIPIPTNESSVITKTLPGMTGILINGVEILNYKSDRNIYYGEVKNIDVISSDNQFDIIDPPNLIIEDSNGTGANGFLGITGSLSAINILDRGFDYEGTPTIKISGGNGNGATASVNMKLSDHVAEFDSKTININTNTIGFSTFHKFRNYEEVTYRTANQRVIAGLTTNASYFVRLADGTTTYRVSVASKTSSHPFFGQGSLNGYYITGDVYGTVTQSPNLQFVRGTTYIFNQNDASSAQHAIYFSAVESAFNGSNRYETGVIYTLDGVNVVYADYVSGFATATERSVSITVSADAPSTLYYTCSQHQYMGNAIAVSSTVGGTDLFNIKLHNTRDDAVAGINTVNLTGNGEGRHDLKAVLRKRQIDSISVIESGEGYSNRKVTLPHTGINTSQNMITAINHGYSTGDKIQYYGSTETTITGLSTDTDYIATVLDKDNFKLSILGIGNTENIFADRGEYINFVTTGTGTHTFNHPPISVTLSGKTGIGSKFVATIQPKFRGLIDNVYVSNGGVGYGVTDIRDFERTPVVRYSIGESTQIKTITNNGQITKAVPLNRGQNFTSAPDIVVDGDGTGAVLTSTIRPDGRLDKIIIIEGGRGYSANNTTIRAVSSESLSRSKFKSSLQSWKINLFQENFDKLEQDDGVLIRSTGKKYGIQYSHIYAPRYLRQIVIPSNAEGKKLYGTNDIPFNRTELDSRNHSPIIGWAYDGNPIYGPYGYISKSGGVVTRMKSGYIDESSLKANRPPNFASGSFVEDFTFYRVEDESTLDENNGRYCITPEFPNGTYAYFATVSDLVDGSGVFKNYKRPVFPYLIGENYYSIPCKFNTERFANQDDFDLNQSDYKRNTSVYNFFDKNTRYPYITLPNDLKQKVTTNTVSRGKVDSVKILNGGDLYKVNDRLVFDQTNSGGSGIAARVSFVEGKEISSIACSTAYSNVEIYPSKVKDKFVAIATAPHAHNDKDIITLSNFSTIKSAYKGSYKVTVPTTQCTIVGLGGTTHALDIIGNSGSPAYLYISNANVDDIRENDILQISDEKVKVLNVEKQSGRLRILRGIDGTSSPIHLVGTAATVNQNKFLFDAKQDNTFKFKLNKEIYFNPAESLGLSPSFVNLGLGVTVTFANPGVGATNVFILPQRVYLKDHNLQTGDVIRYNKNRSDATAINYEDTTTTVGVGSDFIDGRDYYVARFNKDFIGISTVKVGLGSTGVFVGVAATTSNVGLMCFVGAGTSSYHSFTTQYPKITANAVSNKVTVSTATTHGLSSGHRIQFDVKPRIEKTIVVKYDDFNRNIIINPKSFDAVGINTIDGILTIEEHGFSTGDKLIHTSDRAVTAFNNNTPYYVVKIDKDKFKLSETLYNSQLEPPITVVGVATTTGTLGPVNPSINVEGFNVVKFDLSDESLQYTYFQNNYPAFDLDLYEDNIFAKPWIKNPTDTSFKVVKTGTVGQDSIVTLNIDETTPKELFYNLIPKYTPGVPLQESKKGVYIDKSVSGAGAVRIMNSVYSGSHDVTVSTASSFTYSLNKVPENVSYGTTNATLSYITDCTHTNGPISRIEMLNNGENYKVLPGLTTVSTEDGFGSVLELQSFDIGQIKDVEITDYGYDFPSDQTLDPIFYYSQSLRITPFTNIKSIGISSLGKGYLDAKELVVIDGITNKIVEDIDLKFNSKESRVEIIKNTYGMNNVIPKIYPIKSGAGVPVDVGPLSDGMVYDPSTQTVAAVIKTEYSEGDYYPFVPGEKLMVEGCNPGIASSEKGFNSYEYDYDLFTIVAVTPNFGGAAGVVTFSIGDQLGTGLSVVEFNKITSSPRLLPQRDFPTFNVEIQQNNWIIDEIIKSGDKRAIVEDWDEEYSILKINSTDEFLSGDTITGVTSKSRGFIDENIFNYKAYGRYGSTIKRNKGWKQIAGFLNNDLQRIPDNDYYQNFSYSLKSIIPLQTWNDPISAMNHVAGYKKFANYQLESFQKQSSVITSPTLGSSYVSLIKDIVRTIDVNCVNDFDLVRENYYELGDDLVSDNIIFESRFISSYDEAIGNRVLSIDDISYMFSHRPRPEEYVELDSFNLEKHRFLKYIVLARDKRFTSERQVSIFDVIHDDNYGYSNEYGVIATMDQNLGSLDFNVAGGQGSIRFYPIDEKVAFNDLNISYISYKIDDEFLGVGTSAFDDISVISTSSTEFSAVGTGVTIVSIGSTYNGVTAMVSINPDSGSQNEEFAFTQFNLVHDGTNVYTTGGIGDLFTTLGTLPDNVGYGTFWPYLDSGNVIVEFIPNAGIGTTAVINTIQIGLAQTATSGINTYNMNHVKLEARSTNIPSSSSPGINTITGYRFIENSEEFHATKLWVNVSDKTNNEHEFLELMVVETINAVGVASDSYVVEYGNVRTSAGLGTFGAEVDSTGFGLNVHFTPNANIETEVNVLAHHLKSATSDDVDTHIDFTNGVITGDRDDYVGTFNAVKTDFDLTHEGQDIFEYWFDGGSVGIVSVTDNTISLRNHFFVSGEKVSYFRNDINDLTSAIGIGETFITGVGLTTLLPNDGENLFVIKVDDNTIGLATSPTAALLPSPDFINITSVGSGTSHRLLATDQNARVLVTLDNFIQSPIVSTAITSSLRDTALSTTDILEFVGVTSFFGGDNIKINNELMVITGVGIGGSETRVGVRRARLGTRFENHAAGSLITKISGNYNITNSTISFAEAPYGLDPVSDPSNSNELDWQGIAKGSSFSGRSYMRGKISSGTTDAYNNNHVFQDISDRFNAINAIFEIRDTDGNPISGISNDNAVLLINGVFQLPGITVNEDYRLDEVAGITSAIFTGNPQILAEDVGISSFPTAGIIQSVGSSEGFGYQPLVAAAATVSISGVGTITSVHFTGAGTNSAIGNTGSGYRNNEFLEILTKTNHPIAAGTTQIFIDNQNSVFGILNEVHDGTNAYIGVGTIKKANLSKVAGIGNTFVNLTIGNPTFLDIPSGTQVSIGVTLPYGIVNVSAATSNIGSGAVPGLTYDVLDADYNPETGFLSMTLPTNHELDQGDYISIKDNSLHFTCNSDNNTTLKSYPRPNLDFNAWNRPLRLENVEGSTVQTFVGLSTFVYFNITDATYNHNNGDLELTIGNHNFLVGRGISLETDSLTFTCAQDAHSSNHTYPRSTDPAANTTLDISAVTSNTITVNVGTNPATVASGIHTFVSATANALRAGGQYTHTFVGIGTSAVVSTATTSIQHIGFTTVITGTGHVSTNVNITNPGFNLNVGVGTNQVVPQIIFDKPLSYDNIPLVYSSENTLLGVGTQARVDVQVGNGSSVVSFVFKNSGYAYGNGDILTVPIGGQTGIPTTNSSKFEEFKLIVDRTFDDNFNGWSIGSLEILDNVNEYIDGKRKLFPLIRNGERISIIASKGSKIDPAQLLLVFLNNTLQVPGKSYLFAGGNRIRFTEAPRVGDFLRIVFYKGNGSGFDVVTTEVIETVKEGDDLRIKSNEIRFDEEDRTVSDIITTDTVETIPYYGPGNTDNVDLTRPVDWCRQTTDRIIDGLPVSKARKILEPNIFPSANLIKSVGIGSTVFHLDNVRPIFSQTNENTTSLLFQNKIKIHQLVAKETATATANVSTAGTVSSVTITNGGKGYLSNPSVSIASTTGVGIGTTTTASASATITNGVVTGITITNTGGVGYSTLSVPKVLISPPESENFEECEVYYPGGYRGDSGTVVGFATTAIGADTFALFDLYIPANDDVFTLNTFTLAADGLTHDYIAGVGITVTQIGVGDAFVLQNSNIGSATTSITSYDGLGNILGISTSYIDGVYEPVEVQQISRVIGGIGTAVVRVRAKVDNPPVGFDFDANFDGTTGMTTSNYQGSYSWGRVSVATRQTAIAYDAFNMQGLGGISTSPNILRSEPLRSVNYG